MEVTGLVKEFVTIRRLLDRGEEPDPALVSRQAVLKEALILGQCKPARVDCAGRELIVRLHDGDQLVELCAVLATDREIVLALQCVLPVGEEHVLLISIGKKKTLAVSAKVLASAPGLCHFDISELSRADRLSLLETVAIDIARSGLGPLAAPPPAMPESEEQGPSLSGSYFPREKGSAGENGDDPEDGWKLDCA